MLLRVRVEYFSDSECLIKMPDEALHFVDVIPYKCRVSDHDPKVYEVFHCASKNTIIRRTFNDHDCKSLVFEDTFTTGKCLQDENAFHTITFMGQCGNFECSYDIFFIITSVNC